jgi:urea transport system ATP-binding protein
VLDLICGRTRVSEGSIKFRNQEITGYKEQQIVRLGIGRKFQTPTIYEDLTVFENLELSMPVGRDVVGALFWNRTDQVKERVHESRNDLLKDQLDRFALNAQPRSKAVARNRDAADSGPGAFDA